MTRCLTAAQDEDLEVAREDFPDVELFVDVERAGLAGTRGWLALSGCEC